MSFNYHASKKSYLSLLIVVSVFIWACCFSAKGYSQLASQSGNQSEKSTLLSQMPEWYKNYSSSQYALEFPATPENIQALSARLPRLRYQLIYMANLKDDSDVPVFIRIGFFKTTQQAREQLLGSRSSFEQTKIVSVSQEEHASVYQQLVTPTDTSINNGFLLFDSRKNNGSKIESASKAALDFAKAVYSARQYRRAASIYSTIAALSASNSAIWALELNGLCYEKQRDFDTAIDIYSNYLTQYPDSTGYLRVEQRLRALVTAPKDPAEPFKNSKRKNTAFGYRGVFGQHYRTVDRQVNNNPKAESLSLLTTDADLRANASIGDHNVNLRINGYWYKDNLENGESDSRIKRAYINYLHGSSGTSVSIGRQRDFDSGVYTSFDGVTAKYPVWRDLEIGISVGKPVYNSDFYDNIDYQFYSTHGNWTIDENWEIGSYYVEQQIEGVTDRQGIGGILLYQNTRWSSRLNLDYDTAFAELNNLLYSFNFNITPNDNVSLIYGKQRSPFLTASNIFIGQPNLDLNLYLATKENRDSLFDDAFARTSLSTYYYAAYNKKIYDGLRVIFDYYDSTISDIPSSDFLSGLSSTSNSGITFSQNNIGLQLMMDGVFMTSDSVNLGLRQSSGETSSSKQLSISERLRFGSLTILPRFTFTSTAFDFSDTAQTITRASLESSYRFFRSNEFHLEFGSENIKADNLSIESNYFYAGYRLLF